MHKICRFITRLQRCKSLKWQASTIDELVINLKGQMQRGQRDRAE